jgi:hypothetical protein
MTEVPDLREAHEKEKPCRVRGYNKNKTEFNKCDQFLSYCSLERNQ